MKKRLLVIAAVFSMLCLVSPAWAAYLDLQTSVDPESLNAGDTFLMEIYLVGETGDSAVNLSYAFQINFDDTELAVHSTTPLSAAEALPVGFLDITALSTTGNAVIGYDGFSFGSASLTAPIYYGNIEFDVLNPIADGSDDFRVHYVTGAGITIDGNIMQPTSIGRDIGSAVPIPAAAILLGSGLLSLIGINRRRS
ncbi:MAG: hypothetical protein ABIK15_20010 [Pseudomonadota bacterium]